MTAVRKLVNNQPMDDSERAAADGIEGFLKGELDRLHQELTRRAAHVFGFGRWLRPLFVGILAGVIATVIAGLILFYVFGIGDVDDSPTTTITVPRTAG